MIRHLAMLATPKGALVLGPSYVQTSGSKVRDLGVKTCGRNIQGPGSLARTSRVGDVNFALLDFGPESQFPV